MSYEPVGEIAARYATALFGLADQDGTLDQVAADLKALEALIAESVDLRRMMRSPVLGRDAQKRAMLALVDKIELGPLSRKFIGLVASHRRLPHLPHMIMSYHDLLSKRKNVVDVKVSSAVALSDSQKTALEDALKKAIKTEAVLDVSVDPGLLGGMLVKIGSRMVDGSLRSKLQRLQISMKGVG